MHLANVINIYEKSYSQNSLLISHFFTAKRRIKRARAAQTKKHNKNKVLVVPTTIKLINNKREKAISRKMIKGKKRKKKFEEFKYVENFQIFIDLIILPKMILMDAKMLLKYKNTTQLQKCFTYMIQNFSFSFFLNLQIS